MSAVAREIIHALHAHPKSTSLNVNTSVLILENPSNESLTENFGAVLNDICAIVAVSPEAFEKFADNGKNTDTFDVVILSNVFTSTKAIGNAQKISEILKQLLTVLRPSGLSIIRENFEGRSAQVIADLTNLFDVFAMAVCAFDYIIQVEIAKKHNFSIKLKKDSIYTKSNFLDVFWTLTKNIDEPSTAALVGVSDSSKERLRTFREFLDRTQYTEDNVRSYEWIFGENFISPGGIDENRRILKYFRKLAPGQRMLDIGVGIGGGARQAAKEFGIRVLGCDLSSNMILHAFDRIQRDKDYRVEYQISDATVYAHAANSFDAVFSRDCLQHIQHTNQLFTNIFKWLKPGGEFLITMYGKGRGELQPKFLEYVKQRQYYLKNLKEFVEAAKKAGFVNIYTENMTPHFEEILQAERKKAIENKDKFIEEFGEKLFNKHVESWADKLKFIDDDNHNWLLLRAEKPLAVST